MLTPGIGAQYWSDHQHGRAGSADYGREYCADKKHNNVNRGSSFECAFNINAARDSEQCP